MAVRTGVLSGAGYAAYLLTLALLANAAGLLGLAVVVLLVVWFSAGRADACRG